MLSSITPLGERSRNNRWSITAAWYIAGSMLGGISTGLLAGAGGWALRTAWSPGPAEFALAVVAVLVGAIILESGVVDRIPSLQRQVNEDWLTRYRSWVYGIGFGFQLGTGFMTIVTTAATYASFAIVVLTGSPLAGAAVGAVFGGARGSMILVARRAGDPTRLRTLHRRIAALAPRAERWALGVQVVTLVSGLVALAAGTA